MEDDNANNNASVFAKETTRLWRAWRTIHEMVQDRVRSAFSPLRSLEL
jgi:DNA-directed RNA polymerase I, II, and III subunit RPABC1